MPSERLTRSPLLMSRADVGLLVIDLQERLLAAQPHAARIVANTRRLIDAAKALEVAVAMTEQVSDKLGPTVAELAERLPAARSKSVFSAAACEEITNAWHEAGIRQVLLAGIETHVCVAQTAMDLLSDGFEVFVAVDAVGSRFAIDHETALGRMESASVTLTTTEAAMFEWCETADDAAFKAISALAKEVMPEKR
ncbi:MAG: isochorismatase family protein [Planctomycetota bacterium]